MDVTSLLNSTSTAAGQPAKEGGPRSRTPWDAGGYALPIHSHRPQMQHSSMGAPSHSLQSSESSEDVSPAYARHKMSDSRSSLSSYVSSTSSSHSRFSSFSTTSSTFHPLNTLITETSKISLQGEPIDAPQQLECHSAVESRTHSFSPEANLHSLAFAAHQHRLSRSEERSPRDTSSDDTQIGPSVEDVQIVSSRAASQSRPASPSDVLFRRASVSKLSEEPADLSPQTPERYPRLSPAVAALRKLEGGSSSRGHKRSYSAPDIPTITEGKVQMASMAAASSRSLGPAAEPTPPRSRSNSPRATVEFYAAGESENFTNYENVKVICMYIENCDTGSQPRKAISHIFGRNKMCTRLIPQGVWVHYCRKHYQRSRYRNPKEYAKLQCDLVQKQINRLHEWSQYNTWKGKGPVVKDWGLSVRKREQKRLEELNNKGTNNDAESDNDEDPSAAPATAVPSWLLKLCGRGYSTPEIMDIFNRLHRELLDEVIPVFPDIEILPNIVEEKEEPISPKGYVKRRPVNTPHRRSQSLGTSLRTDVGPGSHMIQAGTWSPIAHNQQKRKRFGESGEEEFAERHMARMRVNGGSIDYGRRPYPHRPSISDINEHEHEGENYNYSSRQMTPLYEHSIEGQMPPLPAPVPQRRTSLSMAAHLESSQIPRPRPAMHQRSQSDVGAFHHHAPVPVARGYGVQPGHEHDARMHPAGYHQPHPYPSQIPHPHARPPYEDVQYAQPPPGYLPSNSRHIRHQSTPMDSMPYGGSAHSAYPGPPMPHNMQGRTYPMESTQARSVYTARR